MHTASHYDSRPTTVLGTVMSTWHEGHWIVHKVEATGPDGRRIVIEVPAKKRHTGSVTVKWDPTGRAEPRFTRGTSTWWLWALAVVVVLTIAIAAWQIVT